MIVSWAAANISYGLTGAVLGMREVGALRALTNLILPVAHTTTALQRLVQPYVSGLSGAQGHSATRAPVKIITLLAAGGGCAYLFLMSVFSKQILYFLYGGKFMEFVYLVPWVALCGVLSTADNGFRVGLRAMRSPRSVLLVQCAGAAGCLLIGIPATWMFGLAGVIGSGVLANLATLLVGAQLFHHKAQAAEEIAVPGVD